MQNKFFLRMKLFLALPLLLFLLTLSTISQGQTVNLDQADMDYAPGETVYITGTEFQPGEVVTMTISHIEPGLPLIYHEHAQFQATADANGTFDASWYVEDVELNTTLLLVADGNQGSMTSIVFTDAITMLGIDLNSISSSSVCVGSSIIVNITSTGRGNNTSHRYNVQLSNSTGSFNNPTLIGTSSFVTELQSNLDINATIPSGISAGTGYLIRVKTTMNGNVSRSSAITVNSESTQPTSITGTTNICSGSTTTLSAAGGTLGTSGTYEWGTGTTVGSNIINSANSESYTTSPLTTNTTYWVRIKDPASCTPTAGGAIVTVTVNSLPEIDTHSGNQTISYGQNAGFTVSASGTAPLSYQWQEDRGSGFTDISNGGIYSGATTAALGIAKPPVSMNNYKYRCVVTGPCSPAATSTAATLTVTVRTITITPTAGLNKVYGNPDPTFTYSASETLQTGDSFSGVLGRVAGNNVATYAYTLNSLSAGPNYTLIMNGTNTFAITARPVTITADALSKVYGETDPTYTYQITSGTLAFSDAFTGSLSRDAGENVGTYAITLGTVTLNENYTLTYVGKNLSIGLRSVEITAAPKAKIYGDLDLALTYAISSGTLAFSDVFTGSLTRDAGENVGDYAITQGTVALNENYTLSYVPANLTISKREVTITADAKSKTYGDNDPALTCQISTGNLAFRDAFTGLLTRDAGENVGSYAIEQGTIALSSNYTLTYVPANLIINKREVTITADAKSKTYGDADPMLTYQITSGSLGFSDAFTGALTREAGENVGSYEIGQGTVALNGNYTLSYVPANLMTTKREVTIIADAKSKVYGNADPALSYQITTGSLAFTDAFVGSLSRVTGENVGDYTITQGTVALSSNYTLSYVPTYLTISKREVTITADAKSKVYGNADPALTYQISIGSLSFSDTFTGSLTRDAGENVGDYAITQGTVALNENYTLSYVPANLIIHKREVIITADAKSKTYGDNDPTFTYQITNGSLAFGDAFTGSLTRDAGENVGDYAITQGTVALNENYTLSYVPANLTISKREVSITADALRKVYGDADPLLTYQISSGSLAFSDAFTGALTCEAGENVGSYEIGQGTLALSSNYTLTYVAADLGITARSVTITAYAKIRYIGQVDPELTYKITNGSLVYGDSFSGLLSRALGECEGVYAISRNTVALSSNYTLNYVGANFTIMGVSIDASQSSTPVPTGSSATLSATVTPAAANIAVTFTLDNGVSKVGSSITVKTNSAGLATTTVNNLPVEVYKVAASIGNCIFTTAYLAVYDPNGGFVTGGGWIISPKGAYVADFELSGKANFGFVSKYKKGSNIPEGNTEFQFHTGNLNFSSSSYSIGSLVIAGSQAIYKGVGTINGTGNYGFMVSAVDGQINGGGNIDKFRIKIWDKAIGLTVYDNMINVDENETPTTLLGGGSIVIHSNVNTKKVGEITPEAPAATFEPILKAYPNPFTERLNIEFSYETDTKAKLEIYSVTGDILQTLYDGPVAGGQLYTIEYLPRLNSSQVVFYHLILDGKTKVGKILYSER